MTRVDEAMRRLREGTGPSPAVAIEHEVVPFGQAADFWPSERVSSDAAEEGLGSSVDARALTPAKEPSIDDQPLHDEEPLERTPTVEPTSAVPEAVHDKIVTTAADASLSIEQYRRLAARLHLAQAERGIKSVMVASAVPGEGKTLTSTNLALTLSESYGRQVLLVDGDLRRPSLHEMFGLPNLAGLNDGIKDGVDSKVPVTHVNDRLTLLTAGRPDPDPMSVLSSQRTQRVIAEASRRFDWVIVDTPPVGLLTDAKLLAAFVDVVIIVVRAGETRCKLIEHAVNAIGREKIFGVVLNHVTAEPATDHYHYYTTL